MYGLIQLPHKIFPGRVLSRFGNPNWSTKSTDLRKLDYFLGFLCIQRDITTSPQPPVHYRRKFNAASTKFSHIYDHGKFRQRSGYVPGRRERHLVDMSFQK